MSCVQLFTCHDHLLFTVNDPMYHDTFVLANFIQIQVKLKASDLATMCV